MLGKQNLAGLLKTLVVVLLDQMNGGWSGYYPSIASVTIRRTERALNGYQIDFRWLDLSRLVQGSLESVRCMVRSDKPQPLFTLSENMLVVQTEINKKSFLLKAIISGHNSLGIA